MVERRPPPLCTRTCHPRCSWPRPRPATVTAARELYSWPQPRPRCVTAAELYDGRGRLRIETGTVPHCHLACSDPLAFTIEAFLSDAECDALRTAALPALKRSITAHSVSEIRTSETTFLPHTAPAASALLRRVRRLLPVPYAHLEEVQVARYEHGQFYEGHYDAPAPDHPDYEAFMAQGGQRVATVLTYLSDCGEEGGGTHFPHADLEVRPRKGRALVFFPGFADGSLDPMAWHEALPAKQTKWVAQVWVRQARSPDPMLHKVRSMLDHGG